MTTIEKLSEIKLHNNPRKCVASRSRLFPYKNWRGYLLKQHPEYASSFIPSK
jgi:hypothetical protein